MTDKRIVQVYNNGVWIETDFSNVLKGDKFRLFESSTGEPIIDSKGKKEWIAANHSYEKYGDWVVDVY